MKTEDQIECTIDMFDDEFNWIMEQNFSAVKNANKTNEAMRVNEKHETDSDDTEIDEDYAAGSEPQQAKPVASCSSNCASGEQQLNGRQRRARNHKCQQCDKNFDSPFRLKQHQVVHTGIRAYQCPTCTESFGLKRNLKRHQMVHNNIRTYQCPTCPKAFSRADVLKEHQLLHTGSKAHKCSICSKAFALKSNLVQHQSVHSDSRPYECFICKRTFKLKCALEKHLRKVHPQ